MNPGAALHTSQEKPVGLFPRTKRANLGSTVNTDNKIEEEIKERIALGYKAFFANKNIFQRKLILKMQN